MIRQQFFVITLLASLLFSCGKIDVAKQTNEAYMHASKGQWAEASAKIEDCLPAAPSNPQIYALSALCAYHQETPDLTRALDNMSKASEAMPEDANILFLHAQIAFANKSYIQAQESLEKLFKLNKNDYDAMILHLQATLANQESDKAEKTLKNYPYIKALHAARKTAETYNLMALQALLKKQGKRAVLQELNQSYRKSQKLKGQVYIDSLLNRAIIYDKYFKDPRRALQWYKKYHQETKNQVPTTRTDLVQSRIKALSQ